MTNKELQEKLKQYPDDADVLYSDASKTMERFIVGLSRSEEGEVLYAVIDSFHPLAIQYLRYFTARKRAEAECKRLNAEHRKAEDMSDTYRYVINKLKMGEKV